MQELHIKHVREFPNYTITINGDLFKLSDGIFIKPKSNEYGYYTVRLNVGGKSVYRMLHRLIAEAFIPNPDNFPYVDHIDRNRQNNAVGNLRWVTKAQNQRNMSCHKDSVSKYKGVSWHRKDCKWRARIHLNKKDVFLGNFDTEQEAAQAYNDIAKNYDFYSLNIIEENVHSVGT